MLRKAALLMLTALLLGAGALPAHADDAALGRSGETVFPVGDPAVRMAAEEVLLKVDPERTQADLTFTFANAGPAKQVLMGFPLKETFEGRGHPELNDFRSLVDGVATPVRAEQAGGGEYPGWITWPVAFGANQTRVVQNSYWGTNSYWSNGETMAGYILKTGAAWQDTIGHAVVRAKLNQILPTDLYSVRPAGYHWAGDDLVWEWYDFEPTRDVELHWNHRSWQYTILETMGLDANVAFPPGPPLTSLTQWRLTHPNTSGKPDAFDLVILRIQFLNGDHGSVKEGVQQALDAGIRDSPIAYLAVNEGLRKPQDVMAWPDLNPATIRWLQDRAGTTGEPPAMPELSLRDGPTLAVNLADPDGDLADWGIKVWLGPNESLTPIATAPQDDSWSDNPVAALEQWIALPGDTNSHEFWARAWVVDGRGHRQDTGLVKLSLPAAGQPAQPTAPPQAPAPGETLLQWWWLLLIGAMFAVGLGFRLKRSGPTARQ